MKVSNSIYIMYFLILFDLIQNNTQLSNYAHLNLPEGTSTYTYKFSKPNLKDGENVYFTFLFAKENGLSLTIIDEDNNQISEEIDNSWLFSYKVQNLKSQIFTFKFNREWYRNNANIIFLDNSREININMDEFISLEFNTMEFYDKPLPLIFNFDSIEYDTNIFFSENSNLYYCINEKNNCDYKKIGIETQVTLEKGKKYKIKNNIIKIDNFYYLNSYSISNFYKETEMGLFNFTVHQNLNNYFIVADIRKCKDNFYIYVDYDNDFYVTYITEEEKNMLYLAPNSFNYDKVHDNGMSSMEKEKDYLVIKIRYIFDESINSFIFIFSEVLEIGIENKIFQLEKGDYAIIKKKESTYGKILESSNKNMGKGRISFGRLEELDNLFKEMTNVIIMDSFTTYDFIGVDSSKNQTILNYYEYIKK